MILQGGQTVLSILGMTASYGQKWWIMPSISQCLGVGTSLLELETFLNFWYISLANTQGLGFDVSDIYDSYVIHIFS